MTKLWVDSEPFHNWAPFMGLGHLSLWRNHELVTVLYVVKRKLYGAILSFKNELACVKHVNHVRHVNCEFRGEPRMGHVEILNLSLDKEACLPFFIHSCF